jgi:hypothetical protein
VLLGVLGLRLLENGHGPTIVVAVAVFQITSCVFELFYRVEAFDKCVHFILPWIFVCVIWAQLRAGHGRFQTAVALTLAAVVLYECYEWAMGSVFGAPMQFGAMDTAVDLAAGLGGVAVGALVVVIRTSSVSGRSMAAVVPDIRIAASLRREELPRVTRPTKRDLEDAMGVVADGGAG